MGLFSNLLNEDFVIGTRNVQRFNNDPSSLPDIMNEQHARGIGSDRGLLDHAQEVQRQYERESQDKPLLRWKTGKPKQSFMSKFGESLLKVGATVVIGVAAAKVFTDKD